MGESRVVNGGRGGAISQLVQLLNTLGVERVECDDNANDDDDNKGWRRSVV